MSLDFFPNSTADYVEYGPDEGEVYFRFDDPWSYDAANPRLYLTRYAVLKHTPAGVWLKDEGLVKGRRFVLNGTGKRWAYPTRELALDSYKRRKRRQIVHASATMNNAEFALNIAERITL